MTDSEPEKRIVLKLYGESEKHRIDENRTASLRKYALSRGILCGVKLGTYQDYYYSSEGNGRVDLRFSKTAGLEAVKRLGLTIASDNDLRCLANVFEEPVYSDRGQSINK